MSRDLSQPPKIMATFVSEEVDDFKPLITIKPKKVKKDYGESGNMLEDLVPKAIEQLEEIIDIDVSPSHPEFSKIISVKRQAASDVISAQTKVNENALRSKNVNTLEKLMLIWKEEKQKLMEEALLIDVTPE